MSEQAHEGAELIEIRNGPTGPRPSVIGGMDVWEYVMLARAYNHDLNRALMDFPHETREHFEAALAQYRANPEMSNPWLEEHLPLLPAAPPEAE